MRLLQKAFRAPTVLLVYANIKKSTLKSEIEQVMAVSAATQTSATVFKCSCIEGAIWRSAGVVLTQKNQSAAF